VPEWEEAAVNEHEANQAAVEAAEYWAGMEEDMFSSKEAAYRESLRAGYGIMKDESADAEHGRPRLQRGAIQILDTQYPLRLHADDIALILRLEESNKKLLASLEQIERLISRQLYRI
jgi:hypothetical protein